MAKLSKRAQVEALGWTFKAVPRFWEAGVLWSDSRTGQQSAAHWDHEHPDGWTAAPPAGFPASPRRFDGKSVTPAVRWAYDQAMAPQFKPELGGFGGPVAEEPEVHFSRVCAPGAKSRGRRILGLP